MWSVCGFVSGEPEYVVCFIYIANDAEIKFAGHQLFKSGNSVTRLCRWPGIVYCSTIFGHPQHNQTCKARDSMKLLFDREQYDNYQAVLVNELVTMIRIKLEQAGIEGSQLSDMTASIGSSVTSILDGTTMMQDGDKDVTPFLTFLNEDEELINSGENAYTHEFLYDALKKHFG